MLAPTYCHFLGSASPRPNSEVGLLFRCRTQLILRFEPPAGSTKFLLEGSILERTNPSTGQHGRRQFGDHWKVDAHSVASLDTLALEEVGNLAHLSNECQVARCVFEGQGTFQYAQAAA